MTVHLIAGPPGAGKTTYALEHAGPRDHIVDYDLIQSRVGPARAQAVRLAAEAAAPRLPGDVYVVRSLADPQDRHGVAARVQAKTVTVVATPAPVAVARLQARDGPQAVTDVPAQWWASYRPHSEDRVITPTQRDDLLGRVTVPRTAPDERQQQMSETPGAPTPAEIAAAIKPPTATQGQQSSTEGQQASTATEGQQSSTEGQQAPEGNRLPSTQEELDRLVQRRVAQAERQAERRAQEQAANDWQAKVDQARQETTQQVSRQYAERMARTSIEAAAARAGFIDPADALVHVAPADVLTDGDVDPEAISTKLTALASSKPYLVGGASQQRGPARMKRGTPAPDSTTPPKGAANLMASWARGK